MIEYNTIRCEYDEAPKSGNYHVITSYGHQYWVVNGELHRDNDLPAVIWANGTQKWYKHDKLHRVNNPAIIKTNGSVEYWYKDTKYSKQQYFNLMLANGLISQKQHFAKLL